MSVVVGRVCGVGPKSYSCDEPSLQPGVSQVSFILPRTPFLLCSQADTAISTSRTLQGISEFPRPRGWAIVSMVTLKHAVTLSSEVREKCR